MALIDPCVPMPFDAGNGAAMRADERLSADDFETPPPPPLPPTNNATTTLSTPTSAASVVAAAAAAVVTPVSTTTASVLSSVFSYIFKENVVESSPTNLRPTAPMSPGVSTFSAPTTPRTASSQVSPSARSTHSSPVAPLSPQSLSVDARRMCLVLDLDETLLHSFFPDKVTADQYAFVVEQCRAQERAEQSGVITADQRTLHLVDVGDGTIVVCMFRPGLRSFIATIFNQFDVGVWSAGGKLYVDAICRVLFPPSSQYCPLFQLCWDDVQADYAHSYTKPLTLLTQRFPSLELDQLLLIDNRRENGIHFPTQFLLATDYLPKPWEWANGQSDADDWLTTMAVSLIESRVKDIRSSFAHHRHHMQTHHRHHHIAHRLPFSGILHHSHGHAVHHSHHPLHHAHVHSLLHTHRSAKRRVNLLSFTDDDLFDSVNNGLDDDDDTEFDRDIDETEVDHDVRTLEDAETEREDDDFDADDDNAFMMDVDIPHDEHEESTLMTIQRISHSQPHHTPFTL